MFQYRLLHTGLSDLNRLQWKMSGPNIFGAFQAKIAFTFSRVC
jgi:hypothetical protein